VVRLLGGQIQAELFLFDPNREILTPAYLSFPSLEPNGNDQGKIDFHLEKGIMGWIAERNEKPIVQQKKIEPIHLGPFSSKGAALCVPIFDKPREMMGFICLKTSEKRAFPKRYYLILEALAARIGWVLRNKQTQEQLINSATLNAFGVLGSEFLHQAKAPLGAIVRESKNALANNPLDTNIKENIKNIVTISESLFDESIRLLKKINETRQPIGILNIIENLNETYTQKADKISIEYETDQLASLPDILVGKEQLSGIFRELFQNAINSSKTHPVRVSLIGKLFKKENEFWLEIRIRDFGCGIAQDRLAKIFELGYTAKTVPETAKGLGLWWVKTIVECRLFGKIRATSQLNSGTEFIIEFPCYKGFPCLEAYD